VLYWSVVALMLLVGLFFFLSLCLLVLFLNPFKKKPLSAFSKANSPTAQSLKASSSVFLYVCS
jgi:hypothetical protein